MPREMNDFERKLQSVYTYLILCIPTYLWLWKFISVRYYVRISSNSFNLSLFEKFRRVLVCCEYQSVFGIIGTIESEFYDRTIAWRNFYVRSLEVVLHITFGFVRVKTVRRGLSAFSSLEYSFSFSRTKAQECYVVPWCCTLKTIIIRGILLSKVTSSVSQWKFRT